MSCAMAIIAVGVESDVAPLERRHRALLRIAQAPAKYNERLAFASLWVGERLREMRPNAIGKTTGLAMSIGKIAEFKVHTDNWRLYVERLEQYFAVNKIASELHVPTLITVMGAECYELLHSVNIIRDDDTIRHDEVVSSDESDEFQIL
ncbi:unnamed protein product, partial [Iphiclides podalirius]